MRISNLSKNLVLGFLMLCVSVGFVVYFSNGANNVADAEREGNNVLASETSGSDFGEPGGFVSSIEDSTEGSVYVCPQAASLEEINPRCPNKKILKLGETIDGLTLTTTTYEGKEYYLVLGFINGGGAVNLPPKADASGPYNGYAGLPITFDASNSIDPNDDPLQYRWDFNNDGIWDTDWLDKPLVEHTWNNDYQGIIKLEVSDGQFSSFANSSVKVISPRTLKVEVIDELENAKISKKKIDRRITWIIERIKNSLDEDLWIDGSHLYPKHGIRVFFREIRAIKGLVRLYLKQDIKELEELFEELISKLVLADRILAETALKQAQATLIRNPKYQKKVDRYLAKAQKELIEAQKKLTNNEPDDAVRDYHQAWRYAQMVIEYAQK